MLPSCHQIMFLHEHVASACHSNTPPHTITMTMRCPLGPRCVRSSPSPPSPPSSPPSPARPPRDQLIYAVGDPQPLPDRAARVSALQALLRAAARVGVRNTADAHSNADDSTSPGAARQQPAQTSTLNTRKRKYGRDDRQTDGSSSPHNLQSASPGSEAPHTGPLVLSGRAAVLEPSPAWCPGAWPGLRLVRGCALEGEEGGLRAWLAQEVVGDPPYDMAWLREMTAGDKVGVTGCGIFKMLL